MANRVSPFVATYTSFSGADLVVTFANNPIGELQQISYAIQREKVPVFTLGSPNPRSFSRGKRGIAGSLVIAAFDHDALMKCIKDIWDQIAPPNMFTAAGNAAKTKSEDFSAALDLLAWNKASKNQVFNVEDETSNVYSEGADLFGTAFRQGDAQMVAQVGDNGIITPPGFTTITAQNLQYADQCPPFDVTLTFANEYGQTAFMKIYDLELLNEASGVSVDSVVMEKNYTWIARNISPLYKGIYTRTTTGAIDNVNASGENVGESVGNNL